MEDILWKPLSSRVEFMDLLPTRLEDDLQPVVSIDYSNAALEAHEYLNTIVATGEASSRAANLAEIAIGYNSCGYTAWEIRRRALAAIGSDLSKEDSLTTEVMEAMPKNYQLWNHRRWLGLTLGRGAAARETEFAAQALERDAKNYHAWAHWQVFASQLGAWEQDLAFVAAKLEDDVHNNSAWTERFYILNRRLAAQCGKLVDDLLARELDYVSEKIRLAPHNAAAWRYLTGLGLSERLGKQFWKNPGRIFRLGIEVLTAWPSCVPALDGMAELYATLGAMAVARGQANKAAEAGEAAGRLWARLEVCDPLRRRYWAERRKSLANLCAPQP